MAVKDNLSIEITQYVKVFFECFGLSLKWLAQSAVS